MRQTLLSMALIAILLGSGCGQKGEGEGTVLRFTAIPGDNTTELKEKFAPFERYLGEKMGVKVEYLPTSDYAASVSAFVNGDVQLAWFGGLTGVRARLAVNGARAIAQGKVDPEYRTYFIAHRSSGLKPSKEFPRDLARTKFTFGSQGSTSGRLMPQHFIQENTGQTPLEFFGEEMHFSGSHEQTAQLVSAGTFQAGAIDYKTYLRLVDEGKIDTDLCYILWETPVYPDYNWTAHPDLNRILGPDGMNRLQTCLTAITDPALLQAINRTEGLIPARNEEWDRLADLAQELGLIRP